MCFCPSSFLKFLKSGGWGSLRTRKLHTQTTAGQDVLKQDKSCPRVPAIPPLPQAAPVSTGLGVCQGLTGYRPEFLFSCFLPPLWEEHKRPNFPLCRGET